MSELIWELTKNYNAFLVKKNGVQWSRDPFNLTNRNMFTVSGLAQPNAVSIQAVPPKEKGNAQRVDLRFQKRIREVKDNIVAKQNKGKGKVNTVNANLKNSFYAEHVPVNGIHTASRVIRKRFNVRGRQMQALALRRLAKAHRAAFRREEAKTAEKK